MLLIYRPQPPPRPHRWPRLAGAGARARTPQPPIRARPRVRWRAGTQPRPIPSRLVSFAAPGSSPHGFIPSSPAKAPHPISLPSTPKRPRAATRPDPPRLHVRHVRATSLSAAASVARSRARRSQGAAASRRRAGHGDAPPAGARRVANLHRLLLGPRYCRLAALLGRLALSGAGFGAHLILLMDGWLVRSGGWRGTRMELAASGVGGGLPVPEPAGSGDEVAAAE